MLLFLATLAVAVVIYVFARPTLMKWPAWAALASWVDRPIVALLTKSKQIAVARLAGLAGVAVAVAGSLSDVPIDWSVIGDYVISMLPQSVQGIAQKMFVPLLIWAGGELLRRLSNNKPVELLNAPTTPATIAVEERVEAANAEAVAVSKSEAAKV